MREQSSAGESKVKSKNALLLIRNQKGQAMTEYIILVLMVGLVCIPVFRLLPQAVRGYVRPFYYCLSRPFP